MATISTQAPQTYEEAAAGLAAASAEGTGVRIVGAGTKLGWGTVGPAPATELHTGQLNAIVAHDPGDMTATLQAGVPLAVAQRTFAAAGQMLALDPPLAPAGPDGDPAGAGPTIGGVVATGDSGPLRHRYGLPRDLVVGITVALSDGTIARAGGTVIKNVAGYDLAKLFAGSFGTLGLILEVNVRLHPLHDRAATALGTAGDPAVLSAAAAALAAAPHELEALDVAWHAGRGGLLARCAGPQAERRARRVAGLMREQGLAEVEVTGSDGGLWERQRGGQRSADQAILRVASTPTALAGVLAAADRCQATLVGRAALGTHYLEVAPGEAAALRAALPTGAYSTLLDAPAALRTGDDVWGEASPGSAALMRRIKDRFDPAQTCNPGLFVAGI